VGVLSVIPEAVGTKLPRSRVLCVTRCRRTQPQKTHPFFIGPLPSRKEYTSANMLTNSHLCAQVALSFSSAPRVPCVFTAKRVMMQS